MSLNSTPIPDSVEGFEAIYLGDFLVELSQKLKGALTQNVKLPNGNVVPAGEAFNWLIASISSLPASAIVVPSNIYMGASSVALAQGSGFQAVGLEVIDLGGDSFGVAIKTENAIRNAEKEGWSGFVYKTLFVPATGKAIPSVNGANPYRVFSGPDFPLRIEVAIEAIKAGRQVMVKGNSVVIATSHKTGIVLESTSKEAVGPTVSLPEALLAISSRIQKVENQIDGLMNLSDGTSITEAVLKLKSQSSQ